MTASSSFFSRNQYKELALEQLNTINGIDEWIDKLTLNPLLA